MATKIQWRRATAANWTSTNPILLSGEVGYETDTAKIKIGDGSTAWTGLSYFAGSGLGSVVEDLTPQLGGALDAQNYNVTGVDKIAYSIADGDESALGNLGATEAIDWSTATHFTGTLDSDVTITHTNELSGQKITIALAYDGTAQRTITWTDVDKWQDGTAPTAPSASGEVLLVTLIRLGTTVYGSGGIFS